MNCSFAIRSIVACPIPAVLVAADASALASFSIILMLAPAIHESFLQLGGRKGYLMLDDLAGEDSAEAMISARLPERRVGSG